MYGSEIGSRWNSCNEPVNAGGNVAEGPDSDMMHLDTSRRAAVAMESELLRRSAGTGEEVPVELVKPVPC
jgi:hypothetical protein